MINFQIKTYLLILLSLFGVRAIYAREYESLSDTTIIEHFCGQKAAAIVGVAIPSLMVTYGVASFYVDGIRQLDYDTHDEFLEDNYIWHSKADNYIQFVPAATAFVLKLSGVESRHKTTDMLIIYAMSNVLGGGIVYGTKTLTARERPDGSAANSFPSGHTETAFVAAEFLHQEFGYHSIWISIGGYTVATMVGLSRIFNDRHWVSDVVAGAGIGILSTKAVYWVYPHLQKAFQKKNKNSQAFVFPIYANGVTGLGFSYSF